MASNTCLSWPKLLKLIALAKFFSPTTFEWSPRSLEQKCFFQFQRYHIKGVAVISNFPDVIFLCGLKWPLGQYFEEHFLTYK